VDSPTDDRQPDDLILVEVAESVATLTLNRPEARNALNPALLGRLRTALVEADARHDVAAIVLTGADPAFCAGLDLKAVAAGDLVGAPAGTPRRPREDTARLGELPFDHVAKPLIGAVNGAAVTGGLELALGCDLLVASERARFADTHARVGVMPGWGLTVLLPQAVGLRRARELSFTGNFVDATTALAWGLVNHVVAHELLLDTARALAADMASVPTDNLLAIKRTYRAVERAQTGAALELEATMSREWARRFDRAALAASREVIQARGREQARARPAQ
jgi:enoyl-CoA hydratase